MREMTHFSYITNHLLRDWVQSWTCNFKIWADLMTDNYETYANPYSESPERECYEWFWSSINMDDTLSKEFLEHIHQRVDNVDTGKVKTVPAKDVIKRMKELIEEENS